MAALQATSLAKAGNRSAPGGTSVPNFGGLSMNQPNSFSRPDSGAQDINNHAFSPVSDLQASNQQLNVSPSYLSSFPLVFSCELSFNGPAPQSANERSSDTTDATQAFLSKWPHIHLQPTQCALATSPHWRSKPSWVRSKYITVEGA